MATAKNAIGLAPRITRSKNKRRSAPKPRRHSKALGPKDPMRGDRGRH